MAFVAKLSGGQTCARELYHCLTLGFSSHIKIAIVLQTPQLLCNDVVSHFSICTHLLTFKLRLICRALTGANGGNPMSTAIKLPQPVAQPPEVPASTFLSAHYR